jgi:glucose-1-phosphate cytidylyltransferase
MKVVILAGGFGTRLAEMTGSIPKPMVEIGGKPILWHIMHSYAHYGFTEFVLALGFKSEIIKEYFLNYYAKNSDLTIDLSNGQTTIHERLNMDWKIHLVDTGLNTQTGGRLKRLKDWLYGETFLMTYGDGVSDVNIAELVEFHRNQGKLATLTAVHPPARFGGLVIDGSCVAEFSEKNQSMEGWINGGFFVLEPEVLDYITDDHTIWEKHPLENLAVEGQLSSFFHKGFWQPMDTLREYRQLQEMWDTGNAPWKVWDAVRV